MSKMATGTLKAVKIPTGIKNKLITKPTYPKIYPTCDYTLNFDGCSKGNPGMAGIGIVIYKKGIEIHSACKFIGIKTNNQSEYSAVIFGLKEALKLEIEQISIFGDSQIVINQINGIYKIKSDKLMDLHKEAIELKKQFKYIDFNHVLREKNKRADELSNIALTNIYPTTTIEPNNIANTLIKELDDDFIKEVDDGFIKELDEDFIEEIVLDDISEKTVSNNITTRSRPVKLINSFFPVIKFGNNVLPKIDTKTK
jgi:ribonuclease HI